MLLTTWTRFLIGDLNLDFDLVCVVCFVEFEIGILISSCEFSMLVWTPHYVVFECRF